MTRAGHEILYVTIPRALMERIDAKRGPWGTRKQVVIQALMEAFPAEPTTIRPAKSVRR